MREKNVQTTPSAPTASAVGPCPTFIQISRTPRHWKFTQHHRSTRPPPWPLWPWPSTYLKKWFKWHFSFSRATTVQNYFESMHKCVSYAPDKLNTCIWPFWPLFDPCDLDFQPTWKNVSNGTSPPQGQQLCQIVLKSTHYCTSYGPDKSGRTHACTHIHRTKILTTMSRLPASGLDKKCFKWHFSSRATTVPNCFEIHPLLCKLWSGQIRTDVRTYTKLKL